MLIFVVIQADRHCFTTLGKAICLIPELVGIQWLNISDDDTNRVNISHSILLENT